MLGPLPPLYRWVVCGLALVASVGVCAWLAFTVDTGLLASVGPASGALVGAALGSVVVALLVQHTHGQRRRAQRPR